MFLGYATTSDPSSWTEFIEVQKEQFYGAFIDYQKDLFKHFNVEPESDQVHAFTLESKYLNIYQYPEGKAFFSLFFLIFDLSHFTTFRAGLR